MPPCLSTPPHLTAAIGWLLPLAGWGFVVLFAVALAATAAIQRACRGPRRRPDRRLAAKVLHAEHGLGEDELGRYFFLPTADEAWREVCRVEAEDPEPIWSHPLIGEAVDRVAEPAGDARIRVEHARFAVVYQALRCARLAACTAGYAVPA
jgi:hypothetical protein